MRRYLALVAASAAFLAGCAGAPRSTNAAPPAATRDVHQLPSGASGDLIRYGRDLVLHTRAHAGSYVTARMDCAACHVDAGTKPRGGSLVGVAAQFPQWNKRAHRFIALQDRLAECFLYSMNGRPPAYNSREMLALVAYITYLSRGAKIGATPDPHARLVTLTLSQKPDVKNGARIYTGRCAACHGADGNGNADRYPPLWGAGSFNGGAGMHRLGTMAGFVRYNMPANAPGTLSDKDAYDVAAYVLSHARPRFDKNRVVAFPPQPASYF